MAAYFAIAIGVVAMIAAALLGRRARHLRSYVPVPGQIVEKWVGPASTASAGVADGTRFEAHVKYSYTVAGTEYLGERIALTRETRNRASAERQLERYDGKVTVYVDPHDPNEAVLTRSGIALAACTFALGLVALVGGLVALVS
jgi:hypothetical protein